MTELLERFQRIQLPPHQRRALGLREDWNRNIPRDFVRKIVQAKEAYREALEELKKY